MKFTTALRYLKPKYLIRNRRGTCTVCGKATLFLLTDTPETIRNHALCVRCGSASRHRHLALWIVNAFRGKGIRTLGDFRSHPDLTVHNTSAKGVIFNALGTGPGIMHTEFYDDVERGGRKNGVLNQDLQALTFADGSIDLVISEDVFEHVPDFRAGFSEVHRVLKRGGAHIFTVPYHTGCKTRVLFRMENGKRILIEPIEYHGDPIRGQIPCFTRFGYDTQQILDDMGFDARMEWSSYADQIRHGTFDCCTFIAVKR